MKYTKRKHIHLVTMLAIMASSFPLEAADPREVPWNEVCRVAAGRELHATTTSGESVDGYCVSLDVNEIAVKTSDRGVVRVAKNTVSKLAVARSKGHQLRSLRQGMRKHLSKGTDYLLSPLAPVGAVVVPVTLAWGGFAAPFCLIGDLKAKASGKEEIKMN